MAITFTKPTAAPITDARHHDRAAAGNSSVAEIAKGELRAALAGETDIKRILLKAAAGAGKSYVLKTLVEDAVNHINCQRVAVVAFQNRQLWPLARDLGTQLGQENVTLLTAKNKSKLVPDDVHAAATVVETETAIPPNTRVVITTSHKLGRDYGRTLKHLGPAQNGTDPFDVLFVDEAWQLPHHLYDPIENKAPITVGVGDVGQLPPLEIGTNPWRGDPGFNPYRAWPTNYYNDPKTIEIELPAVWRPTAQQLQLWRAFYPEWETLNCIFAPGDKTIKLGKLTSPAKEIWQQVATGTPTLIEIEGLPDPEAADVDTPLINYAANLLNQLFEAGFTLETATIANATGTPTGQTQTTKPRDQPDDTLITILASRNQAVDDANDAAQKLTQQHNLTDKDLTASTIDSWQGQTNGITIAIHPLNGATELDEFNSHFGRLAVTCTRATHGLLLLTRPGLDQLLQQTPARPGTPHGEPGNRQLPRQTHQRILTTFARATITIPPTP